jgi:hypothetical protein
VGVHGRRKEIEKKIRFYATGSSPVPMQGQFIRNEASRERFVGSFGVVSTKESDTMKKSSKKSVASKSSNHVSEAGTDKYQNAYDKTKDARDALARDQLIPRTIDTAGAVSIALSALPAMKGFRAVIKAAIPGFDVEQFDSIEDDANALFHADGLVASTPDSGGASDLYEACVALREILNSDLKALITRKLLDEKALADVNNIAGYRNVAVALMSLSTIAREHWTTIASKTALTMAEVEHARDLAGQLLTLSGSRDKVESIGEAVEIRQRAATLLVNAYGEARAALAYVRRREDDVVTIAPSLYGNRGPRGKKADATTPAAPPVTTAPSTPATPTPPAVVETPAAPAVVSTSNGAPTTGVAPTAEVLSTSTNGSAHSNEMFKAPTL